MSTTRMTSFAVLACAVVLVCAPPALAVPVYSIDLNSNDSPTAAGFTGLNTSSTNGVGSVMIDGINFFTSSTDGSRDRGGPNDLTRDFIFDDGPGEAVILHFGGAGDLRAGKWRVSMWSWDEGNPVGDQIVAYREDSNAVFIDNNAVVHPTEPMSTFDFISDGVSAYDVFVRENNSQNRSRLNAVRLQLIVPEPGTSLLVALGVLGLAGFRRRRRRMRG